MGISFVGILALLVMGATVLISANIMLGSQRLAGKAVPESLAAMLPDQGRTLVFFHAEQCPPCREMHKVIEHMSAAGVHTLTIDVAEHSDVTQAMQIRATPTCLIVSEGKVWNVVLGACSERKLARLMEKTEAAASAVS